MVASSTAIPSILRDEARFHRNYTAVCDEYEATHTAEPAVCCAFIILYTDSAAKTKG